MLISLSFLFDIYVSGIPKFYGALFIFNGKSFSFWIAFFGSDGCIKYYALHIAFVSDEFAL